MKKYHNKTMIFADFIIKSLNLFRIFDIYTILKSMPNTEIVIITYHKFESNKNWLLPGVSKKNFEKEIQYLKKMYTILSLESFVEKITSDNEIPKRVAILTFDDGYKDNYKIGFPILKNYNIPATIFLSTHYINKRRLFWWDQLNYILNNSKRKIIYFNENQKITLDTKQDIINAYNLFGQKLNQLTNEKKFQALKELEEKTEVQIPYQIGEDHVLSWDEIKEMSKYGINFGSHTVTHPILTRISHDQRKIEIKKSKEDIEKNIKKKVTSFCYPNGKIDDYDNEIINILKNSGYNCAVTTICSNNVNRDNLFSLGRCSHGWNYSSFKFNISKIELNFKNFLNTVKEGFQ